MPPIDLIACPICPGFVIEIIGCADAWQAPKQFDRSVERAVQVARETAVCVITYGLFWKKAMSMYPYRFPNGTADAWHLADSDAANTYLCGYQAKITERCFSVAFVPTYRMLNKHILSIGTLMPQPNVKLNPSDPRGIG